MRGMWEGVITLGGNWGRIEPRGWIASCKYVSAQPSATELVRFLFKPHIQDELVEFGDPLVQATGRAGEMLEVMADNL